MRGTVASTARWCSSRWFGAQTSDYFAQLSGGIHYSCAFKAPPSTHNPPLPLYMRCIQILAGLTYIAFFFRRKATVFFSQSAERDEISTILPVWPHPRDCSLTPLSWSDPDFRQNSQSPDKEPLWSFCVVTKRSSLSFWLTAGRVFPLWPRSVRSRRRCAHLPTKPCTTKGANGVPLLGGEGSAGGGLGEVGSCKGVCEISGKSIVISS